MTFLLVLHLFTANGQIKPYNMAIFADEQDCRIAGALLSRYFTQTRQNVIVKFSCDISS